MTYQELTSSAASAQLGELCGRLARVEFFEGHARSGDVRVARHDGGLEQLTKVPAIEWASLGIRVNTVAPTFIRTDMTASTLGSPQWAAKMLSRIPLGRFGERDDIVGAVAF